MKIFSKFSKIKNFSKLKQASYLIHKSCFNFSLSINNTPFQNYSTDKKQIIIKNTINLTNSNTNTNTSIQKPKSFLINSDPNTTNNMKIKISPQDKQFAIYLKKFISIKSLLKNMTYSEEKMLKLIDCIQCKEFLQGSYYLLNNRYKEAEEIFLELKKIMRSSHYMGTYLYNVILRRLGISRLLQGKVNEGLMELENVYEFSQDRELFNYNFRFNSKIELVKSYMLYSPVGSKASNFAEELLKEESESKILDLPQLSEYYQFLSVKSV
jgi:hypothetical protein